MKNFFIKKEKKQKDLTSDVLSKLKTFNMLPEGMEHMPSEKSLSGAGNNDKRASLKEPQLPAKKSKAVVVKTPDELITGDYGIKDIM